MAWEEAGVGDDLLSDLLDRVERRQAGPGQGCSSVNAGRFTVAPCQETPKRATRDPSIQRRSVQNLRQSHLDTTAARGPPRDGSHHQPTGAQKGKGKGKGKARAKPKPRAKKVSAKQPRTATVTFNVPKGDAAVPELAAAAEGWFYPVSGQFPKRDYQFSMVRAALKHNTLVCLPTGLGKTFIAAVVMYNFTLWFPNGKVVFMAPMKPLVNQQLSACTGITPLDGRQISEMTGKVPPAKRRKEWSTKRVFFITPQILKNDLESEDIVCLVLDEAHNARGNYAYCTVVEKIAAATKYFRIVALSATPGKDARTVQEVLCNLLISKLEVRTNESIDVAPFTHSTKTETIVVKPSDEMEHVRGLFLDVLRETVTRLAKYHVIHETDPEAITKKRLLDAMGKFTNGARPGIGQSEANHILAQLGLAIALYTCWGVLSTHGIRAFQQQCAKICEPGASRTRRQLVQSPQFVAVESWLIKNEGVISHPKMEHLRRIVGEHFEKAAREGVSSRAIVFSHWRDSCEEIAEVLETLAYVQPVQFVGQGGKGKVTQKEQVAVLEKFRAGSYNTLVATCIGEEGLDIGSVDLIVCFDAQSSPLRSVQRSGRTGRKRRGRCVILMSEGSEARSYERSKTAGKSVMKILTEKKASLSLFQSEVTLVPQRLVDHVRCVDFCLKDIPPPSAQARPKPRPASAAEGPVDLELDSDDEVDSFLEALELEASPLPLPLSPSLPPPSSIRGQAASRRSSEALVDSEGKVDDDIDGQIEALLGDSPSPRAMSTTSQAKKSAVNSGEEELDDIDSQLEALLETIPSPGASGATAAVYQLPYGKKRPSPRRLRESVDLCEAHDTNVQLLSPQQLSPPSPTEISLGFSSESSPAGVATVENSMFPRHSLAGALLDSSHPSSCSTSLVTETVEPALTGRSTEAVVLEEAHVFDSASLGWLPRIPAWAACAPRGGRYRGPEIVLLPASPSPIRVSSSTRARVRSVFLPACANTRTANGRLLKEGPAAPPRKVRRKVGKEMTLHDSVPRPGQVEEDLVDLAEQAPDTESLVSSLLADLSQSVFEEPVSRAALPRSSLSPASLSPVSSPVRQPTRLRKLSAMRQSVASPIRARRPERSSKSKAIHSFHRDHKMREETALASHAVPAHLKEKRRLLKQRFVDSEAGCKDFNDSGDDMEEDSQEGSCSELDDFLVSQPDSSPTTTGSLTPRSPSASVFESPIRLRSKRRLQF